MTRRSPSQPARHSRTAERTISASHSSGHNASSGRAPKHGASVEFPPVAMNLTAALLAAAIVCVLLYGHAHYRQLSHWKRWVFFLVAIAVIGKGLLSIAKTVAGNIHHPPEWDFLVFWVGGVAASQGLNYYDAAVALHLAAPFHPDPDWIGITSAVPFPYPPPSIVWFLPLGWFGIHDAAAVWCAFSLVCLCASIIILCLTFFQSLSTINLCVYVSARADVTFCLLESRQLPDRLSSAVVGQFGSALPERSFGWSRGSPLPFL